MVKDIYIIGVGGFAKEVCLLINNINHQKLTYKIKGFIDVNPAISDCIVEGEKYAVIQESEHLKNNLLSDECYAIGIGNPKILEQISKKFSGRVFPNLVHPNVVKGDSVKLGEGNIITAGCILTVDIKIGSFNILNLYTTIGHDTVIGNGNVLNPSVNVSGGCDIKNYNLLGTSATVLQYLNIGTGNIIGASALVTKTIESNGLIVGVPAKKIKDL